MLSDLIFWQIGSIWVDVYMCLHVYKRTECEPSPLVAAEGLQ